MVAAGTWTVLDRLGEQLQEAELSGGERRGALLYFCRACPSVCCRLLCESGEAVTGDLMDEVALEVAGGQ